MVESSPEADRLDTWIHSHDSCYGGGPTLNSLVDELDAEAYILKPMNCPHHIQIYKNEMHSYRDLPLRSEEHTSELQSRQYLVCRLLLEKKKKQKINKH